jgi:outer membrane protein TolC
VDAHARLIGFFMASALLPLSAAGQVRVPERLTLDQALEIAYRNSPSLLRAQNDEIVADWDVRQARGQLLPSASASGRVTWQGSGEQQFGNLTAGDLGFANQPSYYVSGYDLSVSYSLDWAKIKGPARARADRRTTLARIDVAGADLTASVTRAWVDALRGRELLVTARQQLENARINLRLAEGQLGVGAVTPDRRRPGRGPGRACRGSGAYRRRTPSKRHACGSSSRWVCPSNSPSNRSPT